MTKPIFLLALLAPTAAAAHVGDHSHAGLSHFFGDPLHLALLVVAVVVMPIVIWRLVRR
jgi:hypothetical protein